MQGLKHIETDGSSGEHGSVNGTYITPYDCGIVSCMSESVGSAMYKVEVVTLIISRGMEPYMNLQMNTNLKYKGKSDTN